MAETLNFKTNAIGFICSSSGIISVMAAKILDKTHISTLYYSNCS